MSQASAAVETSPTVKKNFALNRPITASQRSPMGEVLSWSSPWVANNEKQPNPRARLRKVLSPTPLSGESLALRWYSSQMRNTGRTLLRIAPAAPLVPYLA